METSRLTRFTSATLAVGAIVLGGCGGSPSETTGEAQTGADGEPAAADFSVTSDKREVTFDGPSEIAGGIVELALTNDGDSPQNLQLITADGDYNQEEALAELEKAMSGAPVADWFHAAGGVSTVEPGETRSVTQVLEPGTYWGISDEGKGELPVIEFEVTDGAGGELPETDATITAADFSFESEGLTAGENTVRFENTGEQWHHVIASPLIGDATIEEAAEFFQQEEPEGEPPIAEEGGDFSNVLDGGEAQNLTMDLEPGRYALLCFISNREGGPPHVALGMASEVEVE